MLIAPSAPRMTLRVFSLWGRWLSLKSAPRMRHLRLSGSLGCRYGTFRSNSYSRPAQELLIARRIGRVDVGLYATKRYLQRHGTPETTADLQRHTLIGFDQPTAFIRTASKSLSISREAFSIRAESDLAQLTLVRSGAGIGFCQVPTGRRGGLVRLLAKQYSLQLDTWIAMHEDLRKSPRCRVTFDALVEGLREHVFGAKSRRAIE
jgi:DNA-binding transcriptional LysR family regulator